jgi:3-phenylpropionate/trans-cinnamate dioxygenase ferredoxin reductase subunit
MEYRGYVGPEGYDRVVFRGDVESYEFVAFWLKDGRVLAGMNVNIWDVGEPIEALIRSGKAVPPELLADTSVPFGEITR